MILNKLMAMIIEMRQVYWIVTAALAPLFFMMVMDRLPRAS